jgi:hypothetical protein
MPEFTPLDDVEGPQADEDQEKSQTDKDHKVLILSLEVFHLLGV